MSGSGDIAARFALFDARNPHVYRELLSLAREAKAHGARKIGMRMLWEVMRWNQRRYLQTDDPSSEYRLNDHYPPFYARKMMAEHPDLADPFETRRAIADRELKIEEARGFASPSPVVSDGPAGQEIESPSGVNTAGPSETTLFSMQPGFDEIVPPRPQNAINDDLDSAA